MTIPKSGARSRFALSYFSLFAIYGISSPYLQILLRDLGYGPAAVGFFLGLFEIVGIAGPFLLSRLADATGRFKPGLLLCAALTLVPLAPLVLARGPVVTGLCLVGIALGLRSMVPLMDSATVAVTTVRKGWDYGLLRATGSAGFVALALVLQFLPGFAQASASQIAIWIGAAAAVFGLCVLLLPESGRGTARPKKGPALLSAGAAPGAAATPGAAAPNAPDVTGVSGATGGASRGASAGAAQSSPPSRHWSGAFALGLAVIALGRLAMAPVNSFFSLYLVDEVKWNAVGAMWALAATAEIPLMMLSGKIVGRLGPMRATMLGTAAIAIRLAIYALFPSPAGVVAAQLLHSLCFGLLHPAGVAFVTLTAPPERRAQAMAAYIGLGVGLPSFLGSALGGIVLQGFGYRLLFGSFIVFALAAAALYLAKRRRLES